MNKKLILTLLFISILASCNKQSSSSQSENTAVNEIKEELTNSMGSIILRDEGAEPVVIDIEKKEIIVPAEVNGQYFNSPTRHGFAFYKGLVGNKAVLRVFQMKENFIRH
ncbi:hypothetical protein [Brachyspira alvinipulli]|uniref:hypothetical protein n=1 Tax=Brachyspira alvinipulli TaxID=84379 RepID=UPI0004B249A3|nr:hypothetical protein [Brachyspira alvinipulli]